ncbi:MAG TPA: FAD-dependent oxidoreductase [Pseudonocardiaceae bacterium]|nr:FAD-dependent oxidoreductase [Pseudonocardiaceae bacterium]
MTPNPDIVVIGGGIAGVSIAYELAAHRRVTLLEAEVSLASHSTGRSAAIYVPGHGTPTMRALISASGPRFAALPEELGGPPLLSPRPMLWVAFDDAGERALRAQLAELTGKPDAPVELPVTEAIARCPTLRPNLLRCAAVTEAACDIDAMALHQAYVRGLRARGGTVLASMPVTGLTTTSAGWRVRYGDEQVLDTADVVDAAGAWADVIAGLAGVRQIGLQPLRRTIVVARVSDPSRIRSPDATALPMVVEATERCYFKAEGEHLLLSPGDETPVDPGDARPDPEDVARALERVEELTALGLRSVQSAWAGLRSFVADRAPVVGSRPEHAGFHFFAGQGGSGIEAAPALAAIGVSMITGQPAPPDVVIDPAALTPLRLDGVTRPPPG